MRKKFVYSPDYWKKPANKLVALVQGRCRQILDDPGGYAVKDLESFKERVEEFIQEVAPLHPRCDPKHLTINVGSNFGNWQTFSIVHRRDNIAETVHFYMITDPESYLKEWGPEFLKPSPGYFGKYITDIEE